MHNFCGSEFWNSSNTWHTNSPRFTECFQKTALAWTPCFFLWLFTPLDLYYSRISEDRDIPRNKFNTSKLITASLLILLSSLDLIYDIITYNGGNRTVYPVDFTTSVIRITSFLLILFLSERCRRRGVRTSGIHFMFWFFMLIFGLPEFLSNFGQGSNELTSYIIYFLLVIATFLLNCFADSSPTFIKHPSSKNVCPETNASFLSKILFLWFDSFAYLGYKKPLEASDLWELQHENSSSGIVPIFENHWMKELQDTFSVHDVEMKSKREKKNLEVFSKKGYRRFGKRKQASILKPLTNSYLSTFVLAFLFSMVQGLFIFANPQILSLLMTYSENNDEPMWKGILYAVLLLLISSIQMIFLTQYSYKANLLGLRIRTSLISVIYKKALNISNVTRKSFTLGELVNLISVDTNNIVELTPFMNFLWCGPIQIVLCLFFLWKYLGPSVLAGLAVMLISVPINIYLISKSNVLQEEQMRYKDQRIKLMIEIMNGVKVLKLYAWELGFEKEILRIREKEMKIMKLQWYIKTADLFLYTSLPILVTLVSFAVFVLSSEKNILDAETVFVSISLFNILRLPLTMLPYMVSAVIQAWISIKRINKFLNSTELSPDAVNHDDGEDYQLLIENGTFTWGESSEAPTLRNINLRVTKGALVALVGTVGSGKSSLLSALLGEMTKVNGKVNTKGSIAYVPQEAWILNDTLRKNIIFGNKFNSKFYNNIIDSCSLKQDIDMFPTGDEIEIGEKGINLSGGQKQRVSLARAIYTDADNYFLDDPLSAVDAHVGKHIFEQVIGPQGLLKDKTRILVTHGITYLPEVDIIVVLKDGMIFETGTYKELLAKEGAFAEFLLNHIQENKGGIFDEEFQKLKQMTDENTKLGWKVTRKLSMKSKEVSEKRQISTMENKHVISGKLIDDEKSEVGNVKWKVYTYYFSSIGLFLITLTFLSEIAYNILYVGSNIWLTVWISDATVIINGIQDVAKNNFYLGIYGLFGIGQALMTVTGSMALFIGARKAAGLLHYNVLRQVFRFPILFFDITPLGRVISRFSVDTSILDFAIPYFLKHFMNSLGMVLSALFVICYNTPAFIFVIIPIACLYYFIQRFYAVISRQLKRLEFVAKAPLYSHFSETIQGIQSIRAYGLQERFIKEIERKLDFSQKSSFAATISLIWAFVRLECVGNLITFFTALFLAFGKNVLNAGLVGLSITYALQITFHLSMFTRHASDVDTNIVACERMKEYEEKSQEAEWEIPSRKLPDNWPDKGFIRIENLQLRYREGLDLVLKGLTLSINGGEKVGIVGRTGAGKSSLTLSLFRIIEPSSGRILIDDVDISSIGLHTLRSKLTIIPQEPVLFSGSLRINLDPLNEHSDESLWSALRMAHLISHVSRLDGRLQYEVTEGGNNFSVGQKQLICLARALLRKTKILVLDEATAAVDLETDDLIQRTIRSEFKDCTVLTIAHRLNTIMDSDRIVVLDQGNMIEYDSPEVLLKNPGSSFYQMAHEAGKI